MKPQGTEIPGMPAKLQGTVKKVEWINPHSWITIDVTGALQPSGVLSVAIVPTSDHVASYHSAESSPAHAEENRARAN